MEEIWKRVTIQGYFKYEVSNTGKIRNSITKKMLKAPVNSSGYSQAHLSDGPIDRNFLMHRLVALAFIPNPENKPQINHIDFDKLNNHVSNLEWCTNSENQIHSYRHGKKVNIGSKNPSALLNEEQVLKIRELFKAGYTRRQLGEMFGTRPMNIKEIVLRKSWKHI